MTASSRDIEQNSSAKEIIPFSIKDGQQLLGLEAYFKTERIERNSSGYYELKVPGISLYEMNKEKWREFSEFLDQFAEAEDLILFSNRIDISNAGTLSRAKKKVKKLYKAIKQYIEVDYS